MHASDLQVSLPIVHRGTGAWEAARLVADSRLAALVVARDDGHPVSVIAATDVLRLLVPRYLVDDPSLARVYDDAGSDELWPRENDRTVGELIDDHDVPVLDLPRVDADATLVDIAVQLVNGNAAIAVVGDRGAPEPMFVTLPDVMAAILASGRGARQ